MLFRSLTRLHYKVDRQGIDERSFCHISELVDCDTAVASRYSHIYLPFITIPTAELGILYYLLVLIGLTYSLVSADPKPTLSFLFGSAFFAVLYSALQAYRATVDLGIVCLFCFSTYVTNLVLLIGLPRALEIPYAQAPAFLLKYYGSALGLSRKNPMPTRLVTHLGFTIGLLLLGLLFFKGLNPQVHQAQVEVPKELYLKAYVGLPKKEINTAGRPFWGNKEAKIVIAEFSDFQCPFCRRAAFTLKPHLKEFRDKVRLVFMNYPLDSSCNPVIQVAMHPVSCMAAKAGFCASKQNKFWEYHDEVFENQKRLSRSTLLELAKTVGLDVSSFEQCLISDEAAAYVKEDLTQGNSLEIHGTPTVYINGRAFPDWPSAKRLRMVIEAEDSGQIPETLPMAP